MWGQEGEWTSVQPAAPIIHKGVDYAKWKSFDLPDSDDEDSPQKKFPPPRVAERDAHGKLVPRLSPAQQQKEQMMEMGRSFDAAAFHVRS